MEKKISPTQAISILYEVADAESSGDYSRAFQLLSVFWNDFKVNPDITELPSDIVAEVFLRCGSIAGYLGRSNEIGNAQEVSRKLLSEAKRRFSKLGFETKLAETENHLALTFERIGDVKNARIFLEHSFSREIPVNHPTRLHSHIIDSLLKLTEKNYDAITQSSIILESLFRQSTDNIYKGCFYNHYGLALKNLGRTDEALDKYLSARFFFFEAAHHQYCGALENNIALLYLAKEQFREAHNFAEKAENSFKLVGDFSRQGYSLDTRANIFLAEENLEKALEFAERGIKLLQNSENLAYLVETYKTKIKTLIKLGRSEEALKIFNTAKKTVKKIDGPTEEKLLEEIEPLFANHGREFI